MNRYIRLGIYAVVGAVSFVLMFLGYITPDHVDQAYVLLGQFLGLAGSGLAMANMTPKNVTKVPVELTPVAGPVAPKDRAPWLEQAQ